MKKLLYILFLFPCWLFGQNRTIDSLRIALKNSKHDTARCNLIENFVAKEALKDNTLWPAFNSQVMKICESNFKKLSVKDPLMYQFKMYYVNALNNVGYLLEFENKNDSAILVYSIGLEISKEIAYKHGLATCLFHLGNVYYSTGNNEKSFDIFNKSLTIFLEIGNKRDASSAMVSLGSIYLRFADNNNAIKSFEGSYKLAKEVNDKSGEAYALDNLGLIYVTLGERDKALKYCTEALKLREEIGDKIGMIKSLSTIGRIMEINGNSAKAFEYFNRSYLLSLETDDKKAASLTLSDIGLLYKNQGDIPKALQYYEQGLKLMEQLNLKPGIATILNNIGSIYKQQGEYLKAEEYFKKSILIQESTGNKKDVGAALTNLGFIYLENGFYEKNSTKEEAMINGRIKAHECFYKFLKLSEEIGSKQSEAIALINLAQIYFKFGDPDCKDSKSSCLSAGIKKAVDYFEKSLKIAEAIKSKKIISSALTNLAKVSFDQKNYSKALTFSKRGLLLGKEMGYPENIKNSALTLSRVYKAIGNPKLALENYELFIQMRDSINNESTRKASIKQQLKYEYEKQAAADSVAHSKDFEIKNVELAKQKVEIRTKKNQQYVLFAGLALVLIFAGFMFNRFKVTQKQKFVIEEQKIIVEEQKKIVEEKQKEILDSIHYAKRIQTALIPSDKYIDKTLNKLHRRG